MQALGGQKDAIHILVAGYTRLYAEMLGDVLKRDRRIRTIGVVSSSHEALDIAVRSPIDVAIISSNLDEQPERGFEVLQELQILHSRIRVIMLLDSGKDEMVVKAFRAGAKGVFSKNSPLLGLSKCVRCVHAGQIWINQKELEQVLKTLSSIRPIHAVDAKGMSLLTKREHEVVECVAEGLTNHEIGARLCLSEHTVKNYLFHIFDKLGVSNRVELLFLTLAGSAQRGEQAGPPLTAVPKLAAGGQHEWAIPPNSVTSYMECLTAERNNSEEGIRIAATKSQLRGALTPEQVSNAERQFADLQNENAGPPRSTMEDHVDQNDSSEMTGS